MTTSIASMITDAVSIESFNRGPIPTVFSAPSSCLSTVTSVDGGGLYFGHMGASYADPACYPSPNTASAGWNLYYCLSFNI
jgi:hypothetical protein